MSAPEGPAMAALDDGAGVAFPATPIFDSLVEQFEGDPRGARVPTWDEVGYVGGRRGLHGYADGEGLG